jgi:hypothetical protein
MSYSLGSVEADPRDEFYAEPEARDARPRFRGLAAALIAFVVIGLFAGGLWFAYLQGARHASGGSNGGEDVPLIRSDARPTKVKPEKPGGMEVPDRDKLIFTQKRAAVEHLLPAPEKPMPRPAAPGTPTLAPETLQVASASVPAAMAAYSGLPTANPSGNTAAAPKIAAKPAAAQPSPARASASRIQLASVRSEDAAVLEWNRIKRANSDLLGSLSATPVRADLGEKGVFYRVLSGPVPDAERLCRELNQRNVGCVVAR